MTQNPKPKMFSTTKIFLDECLGNLKAFGPRRVVIDSSGEAIGSNRAEAKGFQPDIVFIRDDFWTLGAPAYLADVAFNLWRQEFWWFTEPPYEIWRPIEDYKEGGNNEN